MITSKTAMLVFASTPIFVFFAPVVAAQTAAPLWGISDTAPYLHDGRASTIEEAIKWHGGESEAVKQRYLELARIEKDKLLTFLATLRAPVVGSE